MQCVGEERAGRHFVAITDPGSSLEAEARRLGFRDIAFGEPSIGGRFSALSAFGMLPTTLAGLDASDWLQRADDMARACGGDGQSDLGPGAWLGVVLGTLAGAGRDKLTLACSSQIESFGGWLEQLIAESSGKHGHGIVPIDGEDLARPECYGDDRCFVAIELADEPHAERAAALDALRNAGHPVVRITLGDARDLAGELFRWEVATAAACAVLGVNAFDQPDVEAAKIAARRELADGGGSNPRACWAQSEGYRLYADTKLAEVATPAALADALAAHLERLAPGDYFAINAFVTMHDAAGVALDRIRRAVFEHFGVATTLGYGPRFLHSTGQLHKGGPNRGVFLAITCKDAVDWPIPGQEASFGELKSAQALGDFDVLAERGRRALHVHLETDLASGLGSLADAVETACATRSPR